jgi:predicted DNA-binding antitoxin AbrB/MazE fold protein
MFKPLKPMSEEIAEGETVEIIIKDKRLSPDEMLKLAGQVYEGLSEEEIERIALDRSNFFGERGLEIFRQKFCSIPRRRHIATPFMAWLEMSKELKGVLTSLSSL